MNLDSGLLFWTTMLIRSINQQFIYIFECIVSIIMPANALADERRQT